MYKDIDLDKLKCNNDFRWYLERENFFSKDECEELIEIVDKDAVLFQKAFNLNRDIASLLGVNPDKIANKIDSFKHNESMQQKAIKKLNKQLVSLFSKTIKF